jgi:hypothetical protein
VLDYVLKLALGRLHGLPEDRELLNSERRIREVRPIRNGEPHVPAYGRTEFIELGVLRDGVPGLVQDGGEILTVAGRFYFGLVWGICG